MNDKDVDYQQLFQIILKYKIMIVKNTPEHNISKEYSMDSKPYFLQGLQYARMLLMELKKVKQKQNIIQCSPISRKHTKLSNEPIIQQQIVQISTKKNKKRIKIKKDIKCYTQVQDQQDYQCDDRYCQQSSNNSIKFQGFDLCSNQIIPNHQSINHLSPFINNNLISNHHLQSKHLSQKQNQFHCIQQTSKNIHVEKFKKQMEKCQTQINQIGIKLEQINSQIINYQIIFQNLCDCYQANQTISTKNHKLKRQSIRVAQEKQQIINKIQQIDKQYNQLDGMQKKVNQFIAKSVQNYVREVCEFNKNEENLIPQRKKKIQITDVIDEEEDDEESYNDNLNLNYKKMKEKNDQKTKKKVLLEVKKMEKGVSFQDEIDVISKYYQAQLSNI